MNDTPSCTAAFFDRKGELYSLEIFNERSGLVLFVYIDSPHIQRAKVGYAYSILDSENGLRLADFKIEEQRTIVFRKTGLFSFLRPTKREIRHFQGLGIGTQVIKLMLESAKKLGIKRVYGEIVEVDYPKSPNLQRWYEERGFKVEMTDGNSRIKGYISMEL
jgi:GNAT superfamily N-acetyltransferase